MPGLDQIKQGEQGERDRRGRFARGRSGNPAGRPRGCRDHVNHAARLLLAGEGEALTRKAVELALARDPAALRLCLELFVGPYRERAVEFTMPPIRNAADLAGAMAAVADAAAQGAVTPREAMQFGHVIEAYVRAVEATEFERSLRALEAGDAPPDGRPLRRRGGKTNGRWRGARLSLDPPPSRVARRGPNGHGHPRRAGARRRRGGAGDAPLSRRRSGRGPRGTVRQAGIAARRQLQSGGYRGPGSRMGRYL